MLRTKLMMTTSLCLAVGLPAFGQQTTFSQVDTNRDGQLSRGELSAAFGSRAAGQMMSRSDRDRSGGLSVAEVSRSGRDDNESDVSEDDNSRDDNESSDDESDHNESSDDHGGDDGDEGGEDSGDHGEGGDDSGEGGDDGGEGGDDGGEGGEGDD